MCVPPSSDLSPNPNFSVDHRATAHVIGELGAHCREIVAQTAAM
jgi:hypothetical protein